MPLSILLWQFYNCSTSFSFFIPADPDVCCYPGGYFYTCTHGCNGVIKPRSECDGDTCYSCYGNECESGKTNNINEFVRYIINIYYKNTF